MEMSSVNSHEPKRHSAEYRFPDAAGDHHQGLLTNVQVDTKPPGSTEDMNEAVVSSEDINVAVINQNAFVRRVEQVQLNTGAWLDKHQDYLWIVLYVLMAVAYAVYFCYCMYVERLQTEASVRLLWMTIIAVIIIVGKLVCRCRRRGEGEGSHEGSHHSSLSGLKQWIKERESNISWIAVAILYAAVTVFIIVDAAVWTQEPYNLVSLFGMMVFLMLMFVFSYSPAHVNWRAVAWGIGLQFVFALLILRWWVGYAVFEWMGDRFAVLLNFADAGSRFVFGDSFTDHYFAFKVLPVIVFFSAIVSGLYYLGIMQLIIQGIGGFLERVMSTTTGESLNAAANIFVGQSQAPVTIRPLIPYMTRSELHAVVTGGFATIAGSVLAAFISFNIRANHLLSASVMSAPAALAVSKLFYPETQKSRTTLQHVRKIHVEEDHNIIDAFFSGASSSIKLVANMAVNLIAALAILELINTSLEWFGARAGRVEPEYQSITLQYICSYLWYPIPWLMGVELGDCRRVAELVAVKTFLNEFVAYSELNVMIQNKRWFTNHTAANGSYYHDNDDIVLLYDPMFGTVSNNMTLVNGFLQDRSEVIATYALCGFANIGSMGVMLGILNVMAPGRKEEISSIMVRALIAGNVACFLTACIAGIFYQPFD